MSEFSEHVTVPFKALIAVTLPTGILGSGLLYWLSKPFLSSAPFATDWVLLGQISGFTFPLIALGAWLTKRTTIKVAPVLQFNGKKNLTLILRGGPRATKTWIPVDTIQHLEVIRYESTLWRSSAVNTNPEASRHQPPTFWQGFFALRYEGDEAPLGDFGVPGYQGAGLRLSYRARSVVGTDEHLWRIQFPTKDPETLMALLDADSNASSESDS